MHQKAGNAESTNYASKQGGQYEIITDRLQLKRFFQKIHKNLDQQDGDGGEYTKSFAKLSYANQQQRIIDGQHESPE